MGIPIARFIANGLPRPGVNGGDPGVNAGSIVPGTSEPPRNDSHQNSSLHQRSSTVALAGVGSSIPQSGTDMHILAIIKASHRVHIIGSVAVFNVRYIDTSQHLRNTGFAFFVLPSVSQRNHPRRLFRNVPIGIHFNGSVGSGILKFHEFHVVPLAPGSIVARMIDNGRHDGNEFGVGVIGMSHVNGITNADGAVSGR